MELLAIIFTAALAIQLFLWKYGCRIDGHKHYTTEERYLAHEQRYRRVPIIQARCQRCGRLSKEDAEKTAKWAWRLGYFEHSTTYKLDLEEYESN